MFYQTYQAIKDQLTNEVPDLKDVQLFNNQYEGIIHIEPIALIEFTDPVEPVEKSKQTTHTEYSIRLHVLSKVASDKDGVISDTQVESHDNLSDEVRAALEGFTAIISGQAWSSFSAGPAQLVHDHIGWLVATHDFSVKRLA